MLQAVRDLRQDLGGSWLRNSVALGALAWQASAMAPGS